MTDVLELFYKRRSIRKFTDQPVSREDLVTLLKAGMSGPSAMNAQPWKFVVITGKEVIDQFRENLRFANMNAAAVICVLGIKQMPGKRVINEFWVQDCSAATENILLAAAAMGLGTVWVGVHPIPTNERRVRKILHLPEGVIPLNLIYIGHPDENPEPRTQYDEARVYWGPFSETGS